MVVPSIWGPKLWSILHGIGARAGRSAPPVRRDEERELKWLFDHLETIVPCPECRAHIESYRRVVGLPTRAAEYKKWIWEFHNAVNRRGEKSEVSWEAFEQMKANEAVIDSWKVYQTTIKESLLKGVLRQEFMNDFGRHLRMWHGFSS